MELAVLLNQRGDPAAALKILDDMVPLAPAALPLIAAHLAQLAIGSGKGRPVLAMLKTHYLRSSSIDVLEAIVALEMHLGQTSAEARTWYLRHLEREPSLLAAAKWIAGEKLEHEQFHPMVQRALDHAVKPLTRYRCAACGFEAKQHFWQCPGCQAWDSYPARRVEEL